MSAQLDPPIAPERVLPTLNVDGSRRRIRPRLARGPYWRRRRIVAYLLMLVFFIIPYLSIGGRPVMLLDLAARRFTIAGVTFMPTETVLVMLFGLCVGLAILTVTALYGRVWCGWACPQTVYLEFLFRPFERWIEGGAVGSQRLDANRGWHVRRIAKLGAYLLFALFIAHTFLAYFIPVGELVQWMRRSPVEHPGPFLVVMVTTALVLFDFGWFREQTCMVACPYGRLQSALLDRNSLIVGYDAERGEPRRRGVRDRPPELGDCVDCGSCVLTCPTGIDIRDGLQMECIHCTQCIDACNYIMDRIGKPQGLIRYASSVSLEGGRRSGVGARRILYPSALAACIALFAWGLATRTSADVTLLRGAGAPFTRSAEGVVNQVRIKLVNRAAAARRYRIELLDAPDARLIVPVNPLPLAGDAMATPSVFVVLPDAALPAGERTVRFRVSDDHGWSETYPYTLMGPQTPAGGGAK